jgi:aldose 1-epimerase
MMSKSPVVLRNQALELRLAPELGGCILRFDFIGPTGERIPILRPTETSEPGALDTANFPLVPYCNRIRDGRFRFGEREVVIAPNLAGDPSPLHGDGWLSPWQVDEVSEHGAELSFRHRPAEWPWPYEARQDFRLEPDGLDILLSCRNLSDEAMPCGLGQHFYFPCTPETELDTQVSHVWTIDERVLPAAKVDATGRYELAGRRICGQGLDNGFGGWSGKARIRNPTASFEIGLTSPNADFFQVYSPASGRFFAAEPVTHANAALNEPVDSWGELGMKILQPGETMELRVRLDVIPTE